MRTVIDQTRATEEDARAARRSGHARRERTVWLLWLAALVGVLLGAGMAIGTNVSGVVLAGYGLVLALLGASAAVAVRRAAARQREEPSEEERGS